MDGQNVEVGSPQVLVIANDFPPQVGGIQLYVGSIVEDLPHTAALAAAHPEAVAHDRVAPYEVIRSKRSYMLPTRDVARELRRAIDQTRAEVLLVATPWPLVGLAARAGLPLVVAIHGAELRIPGRVPGMRQLLAGQLKQADLILSVSRHTAEFLQGMLGPKTPPVRLFRGVVDLERFSPDVDGGDVRARHGLGDAPVVVCVGRLVPRKGQDMLVRAWPQVLEVVPDARLVLVGSGPLRDDLEQDAESCPPGSVVFAGRVPDDELARYHAAADVFAHPNRDRYLGMESEGFGLVFLEAQACGKPVIAGNSGGSPEALIDGDTGLLVDGTDVDDVADAIIRLLSDPDRAAAMGKRGRQFVEEQFDRRAVMTGLQADLRALVLGEPIRSDL